MDKDLGMYLDSVLTEQPAGKSDVVNGSVSELTERELEVLNAAATVFARRGYANATVQEVASELGILKGSIYYYVSTKDDLLFGVVEQVLNNIDLMYTDVAAQVDRDPLDRFAMCIRLLVQFTAEHQTAIAVLDRDADLLEGDRRAWLLETRRRHVAFVASLIHEAQTLGLADRTRDPVVLARLALGAITSLTKWYEASSAGPRELAETCADLLILGIVGENPG
jgi:AcrR family transcriptional regulator